MPDLDPYLQLQEDTAAQLVTNEYLADIPVITETLGNVVSRIDAGLVKAGVKQNEDNKSGIAIQVLTPKGRGNGGTRSVSNESTVVRVVIYTKPLINDGDQGLQKPPLTVHHHVRNAMLSWNRGPGEAPISLLNWDSNENPARGEINYWADYEVPQIITL